MVARAKISSRTLIEGHAISVAGEPPLKIDEEAGIIYGVRVIGRYSKNNHGVSEAENGTEYTEGCMREALALYEDSDVNANHPPRSNPGVERDVNETFGVLRNCRVDRDPAGDPEVRADLHYFRSHPMAPRVLEDVRRRLGRFGLSHNATARRERFDRAKRRLVIEGLAKARSVDLVKRPSTNRNLWESHAVSTPTTLRQVLEALSLTPKRVAWRTWLLEDDTMAPAMDAPMDAAPAAGEEGDAAWAGFMQEIESIGEKFKSGEMTAKEAGKKVAAFFKAHASLFGSVEPDEDPPEKDKANDEETDKVESEELTQLRAEKKARELCESLLGGGFTPTQL